MMLLTLDCSDLSLLTEGAPLSPLTSSDIAGESA
jgi:hypothetical protein